MAKPGHGCGQTRAMLEQSKLNQQTTTSRNETVIGSHSTKKPQLTPDDFGHRCAHNEQNTHTMNKTYDFSMILQNLFRQHHDWQNYGSDQNQAT
jgi:hypothetical protein